MISNCESIVNNDDYNVNNNEENNEEKKMTDTMTEETAMTETVEKQRESKVFTAEDIRQMKYKDIDQEHARLGRMSYSDMSKADKKNFRRICEEYYRRRDKHKMYQDNKQDSDLITMLKAARDYLSAVLNLIVSNSIPHDTRIEATGTIIRDLADVLAEYPDTKNYKDKFYRSSEYFVDDDYDDLDENPPY